MTNLLSQLKQFSLIVADTGDFDSIRKYQPRDATTNPSLLLKAAQMPEYAPVLEKVVQEVRKAPSGAESRLALAMDHLAIAFGIEILKIVSHRVSTEVDARLSFDTSATVEKARFLIGAYEQAGYSRERILIKIASTWEGIRAAEQLARENIRCNLTLLFSIHQAIACAEAGVQLISPFVGRILDWYKASTGKQDYAAHEDPGVVSVSEIYRYYKQHQYQTIVMGASFRNTGEIEELAGCDRLTISPELLAALDQDHGVLTRKLFPDAQSQHAKRRLDEAAFRWELNENAMATEKLADGIRKFAVDQRALEALMSTRSRA